MRIQISEPPQISNQENLRFWTKLVKESTFIPIGKKKFDQIDKNRRSLDLNVRTNIILDGQATLINLGDAWTLLFDAMKSKFDAQMGLMRKRIENLLEQMTIDAERIKFSEALNRINIRAEEDVTNLRRLHYVKMAEDLAKASYMYKNEYLVAVQNGCDGLAANWNPMGVEIHRLYKKVSFAEI